MYEVIENENTAQVMICRQNDDGSMSFFPADESNPDYVEYLKSLEEDEEVTNIPAVETIQAGTEAELVEQLAAVAQAEGKQSETSEIIAEEPAVEEQTIIDNEIPVDK